MLNSPSVSARDRGAGEAGEAGGEKIQLEADPSSIDTYPTTKLIQQALLTTLDFHSD